MKNDILARLIFLAGFVAMQATAPHAQTDDDFYRGKQIRIVVGNSAGGEYDIAARLVGRYLARYIPGPPNVIVENMPGASGITAVNYLYNVAPQDGATLGAFTHNLPVQAALGDPNIKADMRKIAWIGALGTPSTICVSSGASAVRKGQDVFTRELITGATGAGSSLSIVPTVINSIAGTKFHIVNGYGGIGQVFLAMERGEIEGLCTSLTNFVERGNQIRDGKIHVLFKLDQSPLPGLPDVPSIYDLAKSDEQRQLLHFIFSSGDLGRPLMAPPNVPAARLNVLKAAFAKSVKDPDMIAEAKKMKLDIVYRSSEDLTDVIDRLFTTPENLRARAKQILPRGSD